jgi:hypothetical protein
MFVELLHSCFYEVLVCDQEWCNNDNVSISYKLRKLEYELRGCHFVSSGIIVGPAVVVRGQNPMQHQCLFQSE